MTKREFMKELAGFLAAYLNFYAIGDLDGQEGTAKGLMEYLIAFGEDREHGTPELKLVVEAMNAEAFSDLKCEDKDCYDYGCDSATNFHVTPKSIKAECSYCAGLVQVWPKKK